MKLIDADATLSTVMTDAVYEAMSEITDQEFNHTDSFCVLTPKGKKIRFKKICESTDYCDGCPHSQCMFEEV